MIRGQIYWARLDKIRPAVVVSSAEVLDLPFWQIHLVPVTTSGRHLDLRTSTPIAAQGGLDPQANHFAAAMDLVLASRVPEDGEVLDFIGMVEEDELAGIDAALTEVLGLH